eukprot:scaffold16163_cov106-Isochrysis_galbana.AAC.9
MSTLDACSEPMACKGVGRRVDGIASGGLAQRAASAFTDTGERRRRELEYASPWQHGLVRQT